MAFSPWLYRIARNNCISTLRRRREEAEEPEPSTVGLAPQVEAREELRSLLGDLNTLPENQRTALLLSALGDLSHAEISRVLDCERRKVKSLVFRAVKSLEASREAREVSCEQIRHQLEELSGGSLRRLVVREHLRQCRACRAHKGQLRAGAATFVPLPLQNLVAMLASSGAQKAAVVVSAAAIGTGAVESHLADPEPVHGSPFANGQASVAANLLTTASPAKPAQEQATRARRLGTERDAGSFNRPPHGARLGQLPIVRVQALQPFRPSAQQRLEIVQAH
jgi:hypothetical protein